MQFFERRRIIIKTMEEEEVEEYYNQLQLDQRERATKVKETKKCVRKCINANPNDSMLFFAVRERGSDRLIGTILTKNIGTGKISVQISIPRESNEWSYGVEIVDQFKKICKEEKFFRNIKILKLDTSSKSIRKYMEGKNITSSYISVA